MATVEIVPETTEVRGQRVLIVDDDAGMRETLSDILEDRGFYVVTAGNGEQALDRVKHEEYDLFLIDIMMPGMNGVETLHQIKQVSPDAITVVMTGHSRLEDLVSEALWTGVDGVLYKPFDINDVLDLIDSKVREPVNLPIMDLKRFEVEPEVLGLVPADIARKYTLLPLRAENGYLIVAMSQPTNLYALEDLRLVTELNVKPLRADAEDINAAIRLHYKHVAELDRQVEQIEPRLSAQDASVERLSEEIAAQAPVARVVDLLIRQAVGDRASDVHLCPQEDSLRVRYRIDGELHDVLKPPLHIYAPLLSRIKVLANLNIAERRRPQDGQFTYNVDGNLIDIRVATINTAYGEMAILRVLDKTINVRSLEDVGMLSDVRHAYEAIIRHRWGIVLIAGPTGSGKTSTLYASINRLDKQRRHIVTIEDPIEYRFSGISQVQVNTRADITFASGLRSAVRLDPDIILVGEIRDRETAETALQASLTGHLVLSSIHANDTAGALLRLMDLGVEPFVITSSLLAVVSQRLVRRVCTHCKAQRFVASTEAMAYQREIGDFRSSFDYGSGCTMCAETGYRGRVGLFEMMVMDDELRRLVLRNANSREIREQAIKSGMRTMLNDGMLKVKEGITTPDEVLTKVYALE